MTTQNFDFDDATPVTDTVTPADIIARQRAAGVPELLINMQVSPEKFATGKIKLRECIDGMVIPMKTASLVAQQGGSGKSTGIRGAAARAADTGLFEFFGERQHSRPLKVFLLHGEETEDDVVESFSVIPGAIEAYRRANAAGRLIVASYMDYQDRLAKPESVFDKDGKLTDLGGKIFAAIEQWQPDLVVFDTIGSMSEGEYLDGVTSKNMVNTLNRICSRSGATVIGFLHLTKDAGSKVRSDMTCEEILGLSRGSAMLKNSTRNLIVATKAPADMYPGIQVEDGDELWVGAVKCNITGSKYNGKLFPFVRERRRMTLAACSESGKALGDESDKATKAATHVLIEYLPHLIRAASDYRKPFPVSTRHKFSLQGMLTGPMSSYFEETLSAGIITGALEALVKEGKIVEASNTRSGSGLVYCYPGGPFAEQAAYQERTGSKLTVREGDYPIEELKSKMHELHDAARDGVEDPAWIADAEAAEASRKQAEAAKKSAADEKAAAAKAKADKAAADESEKAARAKARADQSAADEAARAAAKVLSEAKRLATLKRDVAKKDLATAAAELETLAQPLKIAKANLTAAQTRAQADNNPEASEKVERHAAELADIERRAQVAQAAVDAAQESLKAAEGELIRITQKALADAEARASTPALTEGDTPF